MFTVRLGGEFLVLGRLGTAPIGYFCIVRGLVYRFYRVRAQFQVIFEDGMILYFLGRLKDSLGVVIAVVTCIGFSNLGRPPHVRRIHGVYFRRVATGLGVLVRVVGEYVAHPFVELIAWVLRRINVRVLVAGLVNVSLGLPRKCRFVREVLRARGGLLF